MLDDTLPDCASVRLRSDTKALRTFERFVFVEHGRERKSRETRERLSRSVGPRQEMILCVRSIHMAWGMADDALSEELVRQTIEE